MRQTFSLLALAALAACASANVPLEKPNHFLVFLVRPADAPQLSEEAAANLQEAHLANIRRLGAEGHMAAAGPFVDDTRLRGIFVYRTSSSDEARQWLATDPAVRAHRLAGELHAFNAPESTFRTPPAGAKFEPERYSMIVYSGEASAAVEAHHKAFIDDLDRSGQLAMAARFVDGGAIVVVTGTPEEAAAIATRDPYVAEAHLGSEIHPWMTQRGVLAR